MRNPINILIGFLIFFFIQTSFSEYVPAKSRHQILLNLIKQLDSSLIRGDIMSLREIMHPKITFGHSNGFIEDYTSIQMDLLSKKIVYTTIQNQDLPTIIYSDSSLIVYRRIIFVNGKYQGEGFSVLLNVLETWKLDQNIWLLLARQSVKSTHTSE